ncbi:Centrosomal protein of 19 kDa (Cep19) [Durusdinium trenchii]|uniref:Centrosomal protein of 19 kDa n=1 Tax=Durusdinium trenchii TaxID=1381693 RepID=A0ABP0HTK7_9DINO
MSVPELGPGEVCPRRFGLNYDPPAIILEYLEVSTGKLFHRKVAMKRLRASTDPARIAEKLRQVNRPLLTEDNGVAFEQIVSLVKKLQEAMQKYSTMDSSADLSPGSEEIDYHEANLNKLSDDELARHKARMNSSFLANQMKPGDNGYVYDVRADFDAEQSCGWDSDEDEDDEE